jgi:hypothetical protein
MLRHIFLNFYCIKIQYDFFYLIDLVVCMKTRLFFIDIFCNISKKIGYFNIGFVFLQYKNANQY